MYHTLDTQKSMKPLFGHPVSKYRLRPWSVNVFIQVEHLHPICVYMYCYNANLFNTHYSCNKMYGWQHGLSQQGVWVPFWTPKPLKRTPQDTQIFLCGISKNLNPKLIIEFFHLLIIPMTLINDIIPYFDEFIHVYGWNMSILWSPLKIWTPKKFTTANFRHPVAKSWLRHGMAVIK